MKLLDTNGVNYVLSNKAALSDRYYLVPDVKDESEVAELIHARRVPEQIFDITGTPFFNEGVYLNHYNTALNAHNIRSFFNMTGFGDISIIAAIHMLLDVFAEKNDERLFDISEAIEVYTSDGPLRTKIATEFTGKNVILKSITDIV